jgi:phage-related baseplate assembly protein
VSHGTLRVSPYRRLWLTESQRVGRDLTAGALDDMLKVAGMSRMDLESIEGRASEGRAEVSALAWTPRVVTGC